MWVFGKLLVSENLFGKANTGSYPISKILEASFGIQNSGDFLRVASAVKFGAPNL